MFETSGPYTFDRVARLLLSAAVIWGIFSLLSLLGDALLPFVAALVLAYMINPLTEWVQKIVRSRSAAVALTIALLLGAIILMAWIVIPIVVTEIGAMGKTLSALVNNSAVAQQAAERLPPDLWKAVQDFAAREDVRTFFSESGIVSLFQATAKKILPGVWGLLSSTASIFLTLATFIAILLYLIFLLMDFGSLKNTWSNYLPKGFQEPVADFFIEFSEAMNRYFRTQILIALIMGAFFAVGFSMAGLPLAIILGVLTGLLNIVPYLQIAGLIPAFILAGLDSLIAGHGFFYGLLPIAIVFIVAQAVQDLILVPRLQGKAMGLSPWLILLSLSIWGKLLGFLGLLMALPMTVLCIAWYQRYLKSQETPQSSK